MADGVALSIILCTRDRAVPLRESLRALGRVRVPAGLPAELLVVDNASRDDIAAVVAATPLPALSSRVVREPTPGLGRARNTGIAAARGRVLLFTDDDVRPPPQWLEAMSEPILSGSADAVAGGVRIAPHLERTWMRPVHRTWLADTAFLDARRPGEMVGANMAIGRHVLDRVPAFDPELGLGAVGQGDDSLFSWQLVRARFRIAGRLDVAVEHHFDPERLSRQSFRAMAERRGHTLAYLRHHWEHLPVPHARRRLAQAWLGLAARRLRYRGLGADPEGMPVWELEARERLALLRRWPFEAGRPRHYERHGLRRR